nr:MAG TPA: hypothetical protein [Caudoviricetes sp.]
MSAFLLKDFALEAKIKYHVSTCKTRVSTKLVRIRQKIKIGTAHRQYRSLQRP